jgi:gamma-glutamylcyclotransferase (GGCT)/AIG2-like uncharacterized protein YtfP
MAGAPIFVYGTLLDARVLARFAGRGAFRRAVPAQLRGWRCVGLRGTPYPTLLRAPGEVHGLLLPPLPPNALARLAAYEGASYGLVPVRVTTPRGARRARAWMAARWRADRDETWRAIV